MSRDTAPFIVGQDFDEAFERAWKRADVQKECTGLPIPLDVFKKLFKLGYSCCLTDASRHLALAALRKPEGPAA